MPWSQVEHDDKRQHWRPQWYCQWNDGRVCKAYLKPGAKLVPIQMFGYWVYSVTVDEVDQLEFEWQDYDRFKGKFRVDLPKCVQLSFQWPTIGNFATTGHKLQGKSVNELVVAEWSKVKNWAYVVLQESEHWLASSWRNLFHPIDFSPNQTILKWWKGYETIFWLNP
jgi:hypothetical protein